MNIQLQRNYNDYWSSIINTYMNSIFLRLKTFQNPITAKSNQIGLRRLAGVHHRLAIQQKPRKLGESSMRRLVVGSLPSGGSSSGTQITLRLDKLPGGWWTAARQFLENSKNVDFMQIQTVYIHQIII